MSKKKRIAALEAAVARLTAPPHVHRFVFDKHVWPARDGNRASVRYGYKCMADDDAPCVSGSSDSLDRLGVDVDAETRRLLG